MINMNRRTLIYGMVIGLSMPINAKRLSRKEMRAQQQEKKRAAQAKKYKDAYNEIAPLLKPIMDSYHKLRGCKPNEHAYYLRELKKAIHKEVEAGVFEDIFSWWQDKGKVILCGSLLITIEVITRFRDTIIPHIRSILSSTLDFCEDAELKQQGQALLTELKELQLELTY